MNYFEHIHPKRRSITCPYTQGVVMFALGCVFGPNYSSYNQHRRLSKFHRTPIIRHINEDSSSALLYVDATPAITFVKCIVTIEAT